MLQLRVFVLCVDTAQWVLENLCCNLRIFNLNKKLANFVQKQKTKKSFEFERNLLTYDAIPVSLPDRLCVVDLFYRFSRCQHSIQVDFRQRLQHYLIPFLHVIPPDQYGHCH